MADYFPGEITIGGEIPRAVLDELIELIVQEESKKDYDDAWTKEALEEAFITDDSARMGEFHALEEFLVKHKIPFDTHSDAKYEYDATRTYYRGEENFGEAVSFFSTQDGNDLIPLATVESIINDGTKDEKQKVQILHKILAQRTPLPKIEIE